MEKKTKKEWQEERIDSIIQDNVTNVNRIFNNEEDIRTLQTDVEKSKQQYFTSGTGIVITDNRPYGSDDIQISVDTVSLPQPRIDVLEQQILELQETNKALAQYIFDDQKKKGHFSKGGSTNSKPKRRTANPFS